ncbi:MAG: putative lipopolysaccharide heptosyltransferase III [Nitrospinota bacterium]
MKVDHSSIKKILVLRYRSIGDIILSFPTIETLKETYPKARIDMLIDERLADICYAHPHVNYLLLHKSTRGKSGNLSLVMQSLKFIYKIRKQKYDMVVDLHSGPRSSILTLLSGARYRIGSLMRKRHKLFYNLYAEPGGDRKMHTVNVMLKAISPLKPKRLAKKSLFLRYSDEDSLYVKNFLEKYDVTEKETVVMVHPGARVDIKRLPAQRMGEIVNWMTSELGVKVIYAGKDSDLPAIADIVSYSGKPGLMATNLTLGRLAALINSCNVFIGNDSGPMHMAAALDVPIVAFFGPSDPAVWSPWGARGKIVRCTPMDCMPCDQKGCPYVGHHCMTKIKESDIKRAIVSALKMDYSAA